MSNLNLEKLEHLNRLKKKFEALEKEARKAFEKETLSDEHKARFNRANEAYLQAHKEWQKYLLDNASELLPQKL